MQATTIRPLTPGFGCASVSYRANLAKNRGKNARGTPMRPPNLQIVWLYCAPVKYRGFVITPEMWLPITPRKWLPNISDSAKKIVYNTLFRFFFNSAKGQFATFATFGGCLYHLRFQNLIKIERIFDFEVWKNIISAKSFCLYHLRLLNFMPITP